MGQPRSNLKNMLIALPFVLVSVLPAVGAIYVVGSEVPRLIVEMRHRHEFEPTRSLKVTQYRCTNHYMLVIPALGLCTVRYAPAAGSDETELSYTWLGRAPAGPIRLRQLRSDPGIVTTDVSLETFGRQAAAMLPLAIFGALMACFSSLGLYVVAKELWSEWSRRRAPITHKPDSATTSQSPEKSTESPPPPPSAPRTAASPK